MARSHGNRQKHESSNPLQRHLIAAFHRQVVELVRQAAPRRILEVGCGEGYVLAALQQAQVDAELVGIDRSAEAIEVARRRVRPPAALAVEDARDVVARHRHDRPDLVLLLEVLEHLEQPEAMLDDLAELTTSHVLLSVPREPLFRAMNLLRAKNVRAWGNDPEHLNHWSARRFVALVGSRFDVLEVARPFPWTVVLARRRP